MDFRRWFTDFVMMIITIFAKSFSKWEALFFVPYKRNLFHVLPYLLQLVDRAEFENVVEKC